MSQSPPPIPLSLPASNPKKRPSQSSGPPMSSQPPKKPRVQHPLRQASFPAEPDSDPRVYSGSVGGRTDYDARSAVGSFTGSLAGSFAESADGRASVSASMAQGRGGGRKRGRRDRDGAMSVRAGAGGSAGGSVGEGTAAAEDEEDEDDYLGDAGLLGEDQGAADAVAEKENLAILLDAFNPDQSERYDLFKRTKLNKPTLRRIVNQTLSQSVPPAVITTVSGFTKVFVGEIIERARTVQAEWADAADNAVIEAAERAEAEAAERAAERSAAESLAAAQATESHQSTAQPATNGAEEPRIKGEPQDEETGPQENIKPDPAHREQSIQTIAPHTPTAHDQPPPPTSTQSTIPDSPSPRSSIRKSITLPPNMHRGPLLPSHLREALRRSKRAGEGGNVGFSGLSMNGYGVRGSLTWVARGGAGRRLFR